MDTLEFLHVAWMEFTLNVRDALGDLTVQLHALSKDQLLLGTGALITLQFSLIISLCSRQKKLQRLAASLNEELSSTEKALIRERLWRRAGGSRHTTISEVEIDDMLVSLGYVHAGGRPKRDAS